MPRKSPSPRSRLGLVLRPGRRPARAGAVHLLLRRGLVVPQQRPEGLRQLPHHAGRYDAGRSPATTPFATCNDCHTPHDFVGKYATKGRNGFWHSNGFTLQDFHEPIRIADRSANVLQANCLDCHQERWTPSPATRVRGESSLDCLRFMPPFRPRPAPLTAQSPPCQTPTAPAASCTSPAHPVAIAAADRSVTAPADEHSPAEAGGQAHFVRVVELDENTIDPAVWGKNFPRQYDGYKRTVDIERTQHGGSEAPSREAGRTTRG